MFVSGISNVLSSLDKAYGQLITSLESTALDHSSLSDVLITQVADATKSLEKKHEDMKAKVPPVYHPTQNAFDWLSSNINSIRRCCQKETRFTPNAKKYVYTVFSAPHSAHSRSHYTILLGQAKGTVNRAVDLPPE